MAKMFYSAAEAAQKLGTTEDGVRDLVKEGKLREFRDAGTVNYKVDEVDKMAQEMNPPPPSGSSIAPAMSDSAGGSAAEIILEPAEGEDSSVELAGGSDILSLEDLDVDVGGTSAGTKAGADKAEKKKSDSVVASVGVSVFDDDDIDEQVDPLAQTAVTDLAGLGLEGSGGGSGIMDLTRESDDTSLGQELLDEIYSDAPAKTEVEDTKAGIDAPLEEAAEMPEDVPQATAEVAAAPAEPAAAMAVEVSDPLASGLTALLVVAVVVMWFAGLGAAALVRGITPGLLEWVYGNLMFAALGVFVVGVLATVIVFFLAKRSKS